MALNFSTFGKNVKRNLLGLLEAAAEKPPSVSPLRKKCKSRGASASADLSAELEEEADMSDGETRSQEAPDLRGLGPPPFEQPQAEWLQAALGGFSQNMENGLAAFGKQVVAQLHRNSEHAIAAEVAAKEAKDQAAALALQAEEHKAELAKVQADFAALRVTVNTLQSQQQHRPAPAVVRRESPVQTEEEKARALRTGRFGNVGWDDEPDLLKERVRDALREAQVEDEYTGLVAIVHRGKNLGSACELVFSSVAALDNAKIQIKALNKKFPKCHREMWLDRKKGWDELGPSRMLAQLLATSRELEAGREEPLQCERTDIGRAIKVGGHKFWGIDTSTNVVVSSRARARYTQDEIDDAITWANAAR